MSVRASSLLRTIATAVFFSLMVSGSAAASVCGDGILDGGEECDPGGALHINGDPALATCTTGGDCFYAHSCCKFNCQFVGNGATCNDADACTGPDICNQVGTCVGTANSPNGTPCDNGLFCDGTETCTDGSCGSPSGNPCPGTECNTCQEATDSCFDPNGTGCNGGSGCITGQCDGAGTCTGLPNSDPCDDGVFCNGTDTCSAGSCSLHTGDPCTGAPECANVCNETAGDCNVTAGTPCTDDGNGCTDNACNGTGACAATNNAAACQDGIFCNGADTCASGSCSQHGGDPCLDGVGCTLDVCDEGVDTCSNTPQDSACDDALFCNGAETCDPQADCQSGSAPCTDGNSCTVDNCLEADDSCSYDPLPELAQCDDGSKCTIGDECVGGSCVGNDPLLVDLCPWTVVVREDPKGDRIKTFLQSQIDGDICASQLILGASSFDNGDVVAMKDSGRAAIRVGLDAQMTGDIVSGGGGAKGKPTGVKLPYTADLASLAGGSVTAKNDASGTYDLSGGHAQVTACGQARQSYATAASALDLLPSSMNVGQIVMRAGETATLIAPNPGGINVIDAEMVRGGSDVVLELDGAGNPATAVVLRVAGRFQVRGNSTISLIGGLTPERVLIYVTGRKCDIGNHSTGAGTLLCSGARIKVGYDSVWTGAWFAAARLARVGERIELTYEPFQAF
ncbi:MAG: hypothetical protein HY899_19490 [Deltaproteobacteria bacterium]|nr:hypothetical protein [Deltaproteobacteria bacterium]